MHYVSWLDQGQIGFEAGDILGTVGNVGYVVHVNNIQSV